MSVMNDCHDKAMEYAETALVQRIRGNPDKARPLFEQALEWELKAVAELDEPIEPTYSVLHRSAGTLALDCKQYRLAEKLAALAQDLPTEIAEELRELLEQVYLGMKAARQAT